MTNISLTVSPAGIGYSMTDEDLNLVEVRDHGKHKRAIGVRLFNEAHTAEDRRMARSSRRNNLRTKQRIAFLNSALKDDLLKADPDFFNKVEHSQDKGISIYTDRRRFPTIYHLEKYLMTTNEKADITLIYVALHSLLTHRGHFYDTTPLSEFKQASLDLKRSLITLNSLFNRNVFDLTEINKAQSVLSDSQMSKQNKNKELRNLLSGEKPVVKEVLNAIFGYKAKFNIILDIQAGDPSEYSFKLSDPDLDEKLSVLHLDSDPIIMELEKIFSAINLQDLLGGYDNLLDAKISAYNKHGQDLMLFKNFANQQKPDVKEKLLAGYTLYVNNRRHDLKKCREILGVGVTRNFSHDDLMKLIKKYIKKDSDMEIMADNGDFLLRQRNHMNTYIPYQINAQIFNQILRNQGKFYPSLIRENPTIRHNPQAPFYLSQVMQFTLPYWAGVMNPKSKFAWAVHKKDGAVNCFNFYDKIDVIKTADNFIKRMVGKDTYLHDQQVLPNNSLLYQKYKVLNELSNVSVNDHKLSGKIKQNLMRDVFLKHKTVSSKMVIDQLNKYGIKCSNIRGLSDPKKFNNNLSSYIDYSKYFDLKTQSEDVDKMIEYVNIFSDKAILKLKLNQEFNLTDKQFKFVMKQIPSGWGKLSRKLLTGIRNSDNETIMDVMETYPVNFMTAKSMGFNYQIDKYNLSYMKTQTLDDMLNDTYASPSVKRAIRQSIKILDELVRLNHGQKPDKIMLTSYRSREQNRQLKLEQVKQLKRNLNKLGKQNAKPLLDELKGKTALSTKEYLYFQQIGTDVLTGKKLDFEQLHKYRIMHIIPDEIYSDDSNENLILTDVANANRRVFTYGILTVNGKSLRDLWYDLVKLGMFSKGKFYNMITDTSHMSRYQIDHYLNRQLVETNQVNKLLAQIVQSLYSNSEVLQIRDNLIRDMRYHFNFYKIKPLNDYYRAFDAYLANAVGEYLYRTYPVMKKRFMYGQYMDEKQNSTKLFNPLWRIFYGEGDDLKSTKGTVVFSRKALLEKLESVYNYKYMPVSTKIETRKNGQMFNATVYPNKEHDLAKSRKLISRKAGEDPEKFGGYSNEYAAYMALVRVYDKKNCYKNRLVNVPIRKLSDPQLAIAEEVKANFKSADHFKIIRPVVPFYSLVIDNMLKINLTSNAYAYNARQLILDQDDQATIMDYIIDRDGEKHVKKIDLNADDRLVRVYKNILHQMKNYMPFFNRNKIYEKLADKEKAFEKLPLGQKASVIRKMLNLVHANSVSGKFDELGLGNFSLAQPNQVFSDDAKFVMQSVTGLRTIEKPIA